MSNGVNPRGHQGALLRSAAIDKAITYLDLAGAALQQAGSGDEDYERALRQAIVGHYTAKLAASRTELEGLPLVWETEAGLKKRARALDLVS